MLKLHNFFISCFCCHIFVILPFYILFVNYQIFQIIIELLLKFVYIFVRRPRLGSHLPKIIGTGVLFFILASTEAYLRVTRAKSDPSRLLFVASVPLALLDSFICWWIFSSLIQTTRTLRLRR